MTIMNIRRATPDDAERLARLCGAVHAVHAEARPDVFKPFAVSDALIADFRDRLSHEDCHAFIGYVDGEPVGYVLAQVVERGDNPYAYASRVLYVDNMSVNAGYRGKGCGEQLMQ